MAEKKLQYLDRQGAEVCAHRAGCGLWRICALRAAHDLGAGRGVHMKGRHNQNFFAYGGGKPFLPREDEYLKVHYATLGPTKCAQELGRSKQTVCTHATTILGIYVTRYHRKSTIDKARISA